MLSDSLGDTSKKISWNQSLLRNNNARNYDLFMTTNAPWTTVFMRKVAHDATGNRCARFGGARTGYKVPS